MTYEHSITIAPNTSGWEDSDLWRQRMYIDGKDVRFLCQREMVRDLDRELVLNDGFAYWRTTGRLLVTWYNGSVTAIETQEVTHNPVVIDCGYDESLPF